MARANQGAAARLPIRGNIFHAGLGDGRRPGVCKAIGAHHADSITRGAGDAGLRRVIIGAARVVAGHQDNR